jgi:hypothetical protein
MKQTAVEFKNKIDSIIFAESPEIQSKLLKKLYKTMIVKEETQQELHICKYCGAETTQPDDECYAKPQKTNNMTAVQWLQEKMKKHFDEFGGLNYSEYWNEEFQQANELFEQQIIDAYIEGYSSNLNAGDSEQYYNETYKPSA